MQSNDDQGDVSSCASVGRAGVGAIDAAGVLFASPSPDVSARAATGQTGAICSAGAYCQLHGQTNFRPTGAIGGSNLGH